MATSMKPTVALKRFFESEPHGRKLPMSELMELSSEQRLELAGLAAIELGVELETKPPAAPAA